MTSESKCQECERLKVRMQALERALGQVSTAIGAAISQLRRADYAKDYDPENCSCVACVPRVDRPIFRTCPLCGNKRCPHCQNHQWKCTGSNEPNQTPEELEGGE
jgi:hypothetical protein